MEPLARIWPAGSRREPQSDRLERPGAGERPLLRELRQLLPTWIGCLLLYTPLLLFWHSEHGRGYALMGYFVGCLILVGRSFGRDVSTPPAIAGAPTLASARPALLARLLPLACMLCASWLVFTFVCVLFNNPDHFGTLSGLADDGVWWRAFIFQTPRDFTAPILALMAIVPALCVTPYLVLLTRKPLAAIVLTAWLVGSMKILGATVVVLRYGWDADAQGRLCMPWTRPNLLVWLFWGFTATLSIACFILGRQRYLRGQGTSDGGTATQTHDATVGART